MQRIVVRVTPPGELRHRKGDWHDGADSTNRNSAYQIRLRVDATPGAGTVVTALRGLGLCKRLIARSTKETAQVRKCFAAAVTLSPNALTTWKSICSVWRMERCGFSFCACCFDYHLTHGNDVRNRPAGDGARLLSREPGGHFAITC